MSFEHLNVYVAAILREHACVLLAVTGALDAITNLFNDVKNSQFPATQAVSPPASIVFTA